MGAHEPPRYVLEETRIVVEHDGMRDLFEVRCEDPRAMSVRDGRILVTCTDVEIVFGLDDPLVPVEIDRKKIAKPVRIAIVTKAPASAIRYAACSLHPMASIDGRRRPFDVRVDGKPCEQAAVDDAVVLDLRLEAQEGETRVTLESAGGEAARDALATVADELENRIGRTWHFQAEHPDPLKERWYGWQTILADAGAAVSCATVVLCPAGLLLYLIGPPIIHGLHGHKDRAWASVGLRAAFPAAGLITGILVGALTNCGSSSSCRSSSIALGAGIGTAAGGITGAVAMPIADAIIAIDLVPAPGGGTVGLRASF